MCLDPLPSVIHIRREKHEFGHYQWLWNLIDDGTRFWISGIVSQRRELYIKLNEDSNLFEGLFKCPYFHMADNRCHTNTSIISCWKHFSFTKFGNHNFFRQRCKIHTAFHIINCYFS